VKLEKFLPEAGISGFRQIGFSIINGWECIKFSIGARVIATV